MKRFGLLAAFVLSALTILGLAGCGSEPASPTGGTSPNTKQVMKEKPGAGGGGKMKM